MGQVVEKSNVMKELGPVAIVPVQTSNVHGTKGKIGSRGLVLTGLVSNVEGER